MRDARGVEVSMDYLKRQPVWKFRNMATSMRFFSMERHSDGERINEGTTSLNIGVGERDMIFLNWFGREEGDYRSNSVLFSGRHIWNEAWQSSIQSNITATNNSRTWRWMIDTTFYEKTNSYRLAFERIRREINNSMVSPYTETGLQLDIIRDFWRLNFFGRYNERHKEHATNFFGRLEARYEFLHRYIVISYIALGSRAAFETEEQIEVGMEVQF